MNMHLALHLLVATMNIAVVISCPFGPNSDTAAAPNDAVHQQTAGALRRRGRRLTDSPDNKKKLDDIIDNRLRARALLGETECLDEATYDGIVEDIQAASAALPDNVARGHFFGGVVRLAAHDFMDFDVNNINEPMGMDGCIDFNHTANAGLPEDIWCEGCDLRTIFESSYADIMSIADFWTAAANAVILITSGGELDLKDTFAFGRVDAESCVDSANRLPQDSSCTFVEDVFLNRLNMTWTNAVALLGAHTLGRGSINFSGHDGIWVDSVDETIVFDKRYYEEIFRRAWIPRNLDDNGIPQDWTWGNRNGAGGDGSPRFMLNTDMCLLFDIDVARSPDNAVFPCCSRNDLTLNNGNNQCERNVDGFDSAGLANVTCNSYLPQDPRTEAADAVERFASRNGNGFTNDNSEFFQAFREAWGLATTNGWPNLTPLVESCVPTKTPTNAPTLQPTTGSPSSPPTKNPTDAPTPSPTLGPSISPSTPFPSTNPTHSPSFSPTESPSLGPTETCTDPETITITVDCAFIVDTGKCNEYAHLCKDACGDCRCLQRNRVCQADSDCCSSLCLLGTCDCLRNGADNGECTSNAQCCSGNCDNGVCRRAT